MPSLGDVMASAPRMMHHSTMTRFEAGLDKRKLLAEPQRRYGIDIIGESTALRRVLKQVETVAPTGSNVLILGETGTGKELIARAIHNLSPRRDRNFVSANCASIPAGLLESELFGHEKGAYTGAITREIGRFELADQGSIFLDEVGDMPMELQAKLLRVAQMQQFERLGSARTVCVDFRLVAATNRNLLRAVEAGEFRRDLYYRLNVFPIEIPPLRDRPEDIPLLALHFATTCAQRMNKSIEIIRPKDMESLTRYPWPGNVRELQNVIERSAILSTDRVLYTPELHGTKDSEKDDSVKVRSLADAERKHILQALRETDWVIGGPHGAAAQLEVRRTTLLYKMRRLGISRPQLSNHCQ